MGYEILSLILEISKQEENCWEVQLERHSDKTFLTCFKLTYILLPSLHFHWICDRHIKYNISKLEPQDSSPKHASLTVFVSSLIGNTTFPFAQTQILKSTLILKYMSLKKIWGDGRHHALESEKLEGLLRTRLRTGSLSNMSYFNGPGQCWAVYQVVTWKNYLALFIGGST